MQRRLGGFALLSLALHLLLVLGGRGASPVPLATATRLMVRLPPAAKVSAPPPAAIAAGQAEPGPRRAAALRRPAPARMAVVRSNSNSRASPRHLELPATASTPAASDAQAMLAQGKALLHQESRRQMLDPMFAPPSTKTATPLHPLARVGAQPEVGERQISSQIYQYTAANGRRFCVTAPPSGINTLTDSSALTVATNCPH